MNAASWVPLIALLGWLVLVAGAFRAHRVGAKRALTMALMWGAIFLFVTAIFSALAAR